MRAPMKVDLARLRGTLLGPKSFPLWMRESINTTCGSPSFEMQTVCPSDKCGQDECVELTEREYSVCAAICESAQPISFTQLKQTTNLHQEIVSRVVRRLSIHGLVAKVDGKYQGKCDC